MRRNVRMIDLMYLKEDRLYPVKDSVRTKHYNAYDEDGNPIVMTTVNYVQRLATHNVGCIALFADEEDNAFMTYSICNPLDNFNKADARRIAMEKAEKMEAPHPRLTDEDILKFPKHLRGQAIEICYKLLGLA